MASSSWVVIPARRSRGFRSYRSGNTAGSRSCSPCAVRETSSSWRFGGFGSARTLSSSFKGENIRLEVTPRIGKVAALFDPDDPPQGQRDRRLHVDGLNIQNPLVPWTAPEQCLSSRLRDRLHVFKIDHQKVWAPLVNTPQSGLHLLARPNALQADAAK